jgi:hypothetical protein
MREVCGDLKLVGHESLVPEFIPLIRRGLRPQKFDVKGQEE